MNVNIRPLRRRSRRDQLIKAAREIQLPSLNEIHPPKAVRSAATAIAVAAAASAVVSALRRRIESPGDDR